MSRFDLTKRSHHLSLRQLSSGSGANVIFRDLNAALFQKMDRPCSRPANEHTCGAIQQKEPMPCRRRLTPQ
jgi:hypothetical protein